VSVGARNLHRLAGALDRLRREALAGTCAMAGCNRQAAGWIEGWDLHPRGICNDHATAAIRLGYVVHTDGGTDMTGSTPAPYAVVLPDGTTAVNLCGHAIRLVAADGTAWEWPAAEHPAHAPAASDRRDLGSPAEPEMWAVRYDRPAALPAPQAGTVYIVSLVTALLAEGRHDLVTPHGQRRTADGRLLVTECTGLAYCYPPPESYRPVPEDQAVGARLYADADRCEHGRHFGDVCGSGCLGGVSLGHPATRDGSPATIAYSLDGYRWMAPVGRGHVEYLPPEAGP